MMLPAFSVHAGHVLILRLVLLCSLIFSMFKWLEVFYPSFPLVCLAV